MSWESILRLLDPLGGADVRQYSFTPEALQHFRFFSFWELSDLAEGLGILLGWQRMPREVDGAAAGVKGGAATQRSGRLPTRTPAREEVEINPRDKTKRLEWRAEDRLILVVQTQTWSDC